MENRNRKTDYQKVVRVGDQKWEIVEIIIRIIFFVWDSYLLFFIYAGNFPVPPEKKSPPPRKPIPTQNPNLPISLLKNGSVSPPSPRGDADYEISLDMSMYIFNCNKTVEAIILKCSQGHP